VQRNELLLLELVLSIFFYDNKNQIILFYLGLWVHKKIHWFLDLNNYLVNYVCIRSGKCSFEIIGLLLSIRKFTNREI